MKFDTKQLIRLALLIAAQVVLSRFVSIATSITKIGFGFVPIMLAGALYGAPGGCVVALLSDIIGALLFPQGSFFIGFSISAALGGAVLGLCFGKHKSRTLLGILLAYGIYGLTVTLGANALCIAYLYGTPYIALLPKRLIQLAVMLPVQTVVTYLLLSVAHLDDRLRGRASV